MIVFVVFLGLGFGSSQRYTIIALEETLLSPSTSLFLEFHLLPCLFPSSRRAKNCLCCMHVSVRTHALLTDTDVSKDRQFDTLATPHGL